MGRRFPANDIHSLHPVLSFSLLAAGIAAALAIIAGLCGVRPRRRLRNSPPPSPAPTAKLPNKTLDSQNDVAAAQELRLPLPPAMKQLVRESYSCNDMAGKLAASEQKKVSASSSMQVIERSLSMARPCNNSTTRDHNKKEDHDHQIIRNKTTVKMDHQDSIWMKTIILGEKCKVPDHHGDGNGDRDHGEGDRESHGVIYEGFNGVKITAYHPRTASSLSISRQCSFVEHESISARLDQRGKLVKNLEMINWVMHLFILFGFLYALYYIFIYGLNLLNSVFNWNMIFFFLPIY